MASGWSTHAAAATMRSCAPQIGICSSRPSRRTDRRWSLPRMRRSVGIVQRRPRSGSPALVARGIGRSRLSRPRTSIASRPGFRVEMRSCSRVRRPQKEGRGGYGLTVVSTVSGATRPLTAGDLDGDAAVSTADRVAFVRAREGFGTIGGVLQLRGDILVIPAAGGAPRRAAGPACVSPAWSPHGTTLVYACYRGRRAALFTSSPDGSHRRQITSGRLTDTTPAWSPDGHWLTFARGASGPHQLYVMKLSTRRAHRITSARASYDAQQPDWQPLPTR